VSVNRHKSPKRYDDIGADILIYNIKYYSFLEYNKDCFTL